MRRAARTLAGELRGKLDEALGVGSLAVAGMAFLAVVREGLETALLFYAAAQGATTTAAPLLGISRGHRSPSVVLGVRHLRQRAPDQPHHVLHLDRRCC